jgi:Ankyrin repeats (3 copies)
MCAEPWGEQVVPFLLQQWPASVRKKALGGRSVLHHAVVGLGGPALVNLILSRDPSLLRARATDGALALHDAAVKYEDLATVQTLIELDPEAIHATLNNGWTPLHAAAKNDDGESAVAFARILLEHAPDLVRSRSVDGSLPIQCASRVGTLELVEFLDECWPESIEMCRRRWSYAATFRLDFATTRSSSLPCRPAARSSCPSYFCRPAATPLSREVPIVAVFGPIPRRKAARGINDESHGQLRRSTLARSGCPQGPSAGDCGIPCGRVAGVAESAGRARENSGGAGGSKRKRRAPGSDFRAPS